MTIKLSKWLFISFFLSTTAAWSLLEPGISAAEGIGTTASDVTISDYSRTDLSLVAQMHAARIFTDYERRGFFRIGLLPVPVIENVSMQIQSADCLTNDLFAVHSWGRLGIGVRRLEFRNLEINLFGEKQPRLRAASAHVGQEGALELSTVSLPDYIEYQKPIPHATLQLTGSSKGWLYWNLDGHQEQVFVFKPISGKTS